MAGLPPSWRGRRTGQYHRRAHGLQRRLCAAAAIERETVIAARAGAMITPYASLRTDLRRETVFDLAHVAPADGTATPCVEANYVRGVAAGLLARYPVRGFDGVVQGNVPIGSGLSSSAALEMAAVQAFAGAGGFTVPPDQAARIGQKRNTISSREHRVDGPTGLALGWPDRVLLIDCRDLSYRPVPAPSRCDHPDRGHRGARQLASSAYNERRSQCEAAAAAMGVTALRDARGRSGCWRGSICLR